MIGKGNWPAAVFPIQTDDGEVACQFGHSKQKGTPQVAVCLEILRGPYAGQKITWMGFFTDATEERTLKSLRLLGFEGDDLGAFVTQHPTNEVVAVVEHETYDGKTRAKVAWINDPTGGGMRMANALSGADLRKFGAKFKSALKAIPATKTVEARREAPSELPADGGEFDQSRPDPDPGNGSGHDGDDDIPF